MKRSPGHWVLLGLSAAAVVGLAVLGLAVTPAAEGHGTHEKLGLPPCTSMELFGVPCPGCGVTTSVALAVRGEVGEALRTQPFGLVVGLLALLAAPWALWGHLRGRDLGRDFVKLASAPVLTALAVLLLAAWGYKLWVVLGA